MNNKQIKFNVKKLVYLIFLLFTFISCSNNKRGTLTKESVTNVLKWSDFKKKSLVGSIMPITNLSSPLSMLVISGKNTLVIGNRNGDYLCNVYSLDSLKFIKSFAKKGIDSTEQLIAFILRYSSKNGCLYITDPLKNTIFIYSMDSVLKNNLTRPQTSVYIHCNQFERGIFMSDGKIVDLHQNLIKDSLIKRLTFYDSIGNFQFNIGDLPFRQKGFAPFEDNQVCAAGLTITSNESAIILYYFAADMLEIYTSYGKLIKRIKGPDNFDPNFIRKTKGNMSRIVPTKEARSGFAGVASNKNSVFALYDGSKVGGTDHPNRILTFDSMLNPQTLYTLNIPIDEFDVDWSRHKIYGLSDRLKDKIIIFDF